MSTSCTVLHVSNSIFNQYWYSKKIQTEHDTEIQDDNCGNIIAPTNDIENPDINDTEVINQHNIINDVIIDHTMNMTPDSMVQLFDGALTKK